MNEKRIINDLKNGNSEAFKVLYDEYYLKVFNYISGKMDNKANTDDLVQLTFMKIYKNIGNFDSKKSTFYKFALANCNQVLADYYTKEKRRNDIAETVGLDEQFIDAEMADYSEISENQYNLKSVFGKLTAEQKLAFELIYIKHLSIKEAAERMGKTESSVKSLAFRARNVLKEEITRRNPEIGKRYGFIKGIKIALVAAACFAIIGGFAYAMYRVYKEKVEKKTFTLKEVRQELPDEESEITREEAVGKINEYLGIIGIDTEVSEEAVSLKKDYKNLRMCWNYKNDNYVISIDSNTGRLFYYSVLNYDYLGNSNDYEEILMKLNISNEYELYKIEENETITKLEYAKKYGEIFNLYQRVSVSIKNRKIMFLSILDYPYDDEEIIISKEDAINILRDRNIKIDDLELSIELIDYNLVDNNEDIFSGIIEEIESAEDMRLMHTDIVVQKVWKGMNEDKKIFLIDAYTGEIYKEHNSIEKLKSN